MSNIKRVVYIILGILSFIVGILGCILPVLPGGIFLVISGVYFMKVSPRFSNWVRKRRLYRKYLMKYFDKYVQDKSDNNPEDGKVV